MKITNNILILPKSIIDIGDLLLESGRTNDEILKTIEVTGIKSISLAHPKMLTEFVFDGLSLIFQKNKSFFEGIEAIIVVSQSYDQRIPSISTRIQSKFGIRSDAFCIDLFDGCSGYIKALSLTKMLGKIGYKKTLIVAGDINSSMTSKSDIGTKILFGDGISISVIEADNLENNIRLFNDGDHNNVISCSTKNNMMIMNGFEVFRFTKKKVPKLINSYLEEVGTTLNSYDLVALHQASKLVVSTLFNILKYSNKHGKDFASENFGNLGAASIGAWLSNIHDLEKKGKLKMLAVGFGSGLSWGLASLTIELKQNEVCYV